MTVAVASAIVLVGVSVAILFSPVWIGFEQERSGVAAITGYSQTDVRRATGSILDDLFTGRGDFKVAVEGSPVLDASERSHMVDVRNVLRGSGLVLGLAAVVLLGLIATFRRRQWLWRAVDRGARAVLIVGALGTVVGLFFFDQAFLLFHLIFFPQGNFEFDPRTERLTQLFPDQFWSETVVVMVALAIGMSVVASVLSRRLSARLAV